MRAVHAAVAATAVTLVGIVSACGGRGPLDDAPVIFVSADASVDVAVDVDVSAPTNDASIDAAPVITPVDAGGDGGIVACGSCLIGQCSQTILSCVQNTSCRNIFQCVITTCTASGKLDPTCLLGCAAGDFSGLTDVFAVYQCLTATCGGDCNGVLGGLGGLGGGGGQTDAGKARADVPEAFSPWPELFSRADAR